MWDEPVTLPSLVIWSIFGHSNQYTETEVQERVLIPMLECLGTVPHKILLPSEGNSSIYVQEWAESLRIQTQVFHADWARHGKIAQILRDGRMQKECTHALFFLTPKSTRLERCAESLCKKGKIVFTTTSLELTQLEREPASTPAHKSDTGTMLPFLKCQTK